MTYSELAGYIAKWFRHDETRFDQLAANDTAILDKQTAILSNQVLLLKAIETMSAELDTLNTADAAVKAAVGALISRVDAISQALATAVANNDAAGMATVSSDLNALVASINETLTRDPAPATGTGTGTGSGSGSGSASGSGSGSASA